MELYIDIIHYHILQSHSRYCYDLFCNNESKKVNYFKAYLGLFTKKVPLQTIKICIAVRSL